MKVNSYVNVEDIDQYFAGRRNIEGPHVCITIIPREICSTPSNCNFYSF
jgi:hypothetical protein